MLIKSIIKKFSNNNVDLEVYPDAIIIISALNEVVGWNRKAEKIFGYLENEIVGRNVAVLFDNNIEKIHLSVYERRSQISNAKTRSEKDIIVEVNCCEFHKDGRTIITVKEITNSQKVIEKLLLEYERVSKVANKKSGFIAAYATELRNPLQSIVSFSQGMIDGVCGKLEEKQEKYVNIVNKNAIAVLALIENMITLSQIEANLITVENKVFDVTVLIESIKNDMEVTAQDKNINLEIDYSALERREVFSDEALMRKIFVNIISNAIKFTDVGSVYVSFAHPEIETVNDSGIYPIPYFTGKSYVMVTVTDTGIGIAEEDKDHIFEEFNHSSKNISKKYGGSGLGLALTKKITTILGGSIDVTSTSGKGSTFKVILPAERVLTPLIPQGAE
jgi:PAS domain S-box-containing protein